MALCVNGFYSIVVFKKQIFTNFINSNCSVDILVKNTSKKISSSLAERITKLFCFLPCMLCPFNIQLHFLIEN